MKKQITPLIYLFTIILLSQVIIAIEPTQQYSKIYLQPFYSSGLTANTNYSYKLIVNPPDRISSVINAIITYQLYISPALNFTIWVDGQSCNTPHYYISTTYAGAGQGDVTFDCSNRIKKSGEYNITLRMSKNTGAITGWLDLTYINNPNGEMTIHGTEYVFGQTSKAWLQLLNTTGQAINTGVCYVDIYNPDQTIFIDRAVMNNMNNDGIYYYDFPLPEIEGVYPVIALCYYEAGQTHNYATNFTIINGTIDGGTINNTQIADSTFYLTTESPSGLGNPRRYRGEFEFNNNACGNISELLLTGISIEFSGRWNSNVAGDYMTISIYNYTNSSWQALPNTIAGSGTGIKTVTNSIILTNTTKAGLMNITSGQKIKIRFQDTNIADTTSSGLDYDYLSLTCEQLTNPNWQMVQGSSEIHLTNPQGYAFVAETLCNGANPDSSNCAYLTTHTDYEPEGIIIENITISNPLGHEIDEPYFYSTPQSIDCTAIISVNITIGNTTTDLLNETIFELGKKENCALAIPINMNVGEQNAQINIMMDNYMTWETIRTNDLVVAYRSVLDDYCDAISTQYNFTYETPLYNTAINLSNITPIIGCLRVKDDLYWYDTYLNQSYDCTTTGCYESLFFEINRWYFPALYQQFEVIQTILRNNNQLQIIANINLTDSRIINFSTTTNQTLQQILYEITQISINQTGINLTEITDYLTSMNANITQNCGEIQNQLTNLSLQHNLSEEFIQAMNQTINQNIYDTQTMITSINQTMLYHFNITNNKIDNLQINLTNQLNNLQINLTGQLNEIMNYLIYINQTTIETRNLAQQIWDYITSWLNGTINQLEFKLDLLLNASNITITPITITQTNNAPCITGSNWIIQATVKGNYGQTLDNNTVACNITSTLWNLSTMTYQTEGYFEYTQLCPAPNNWTYNITCEEI